MISQDDMRTIAKEMGLEEKEYLDSAGVWSPYELLCGHGRASPGS